MFGDDTNGLFFSFEHDDNSNGLYDDSLSFSYTGEDQVEHYFACEETENAISFGGHFGFTDDNGEVHFC